MRDAEVLQLLETLSYMETDPLKYIGPEVDEEGNIYDDKEEIDPKTGRRKKKAAAEEDEDEHAEKLGDENIIRTHMADESGKRSDVYNECIEDLKKRQEIAEAGKTLDQMSDVELAAAQQAALASGKPDQVNKPFSAPFNKKATGKPPGNPLTSPLPKKPTQFDNNEVVSGVAKILKAMRSATSPLGNTSHDSVTAMDTQSKEDLYQASRVDQILKGVMATTPAGRHARAQVDAATRELHAARKNRADTSRLADRRRRADVLLDLYGIRG